MKASINHDLLSQIYKDEVDAKIIEVLEMDISDDEKIKLLVEFIRRTKDDKL